MVAVEVAASGDHSEVASHVAVYVVWSLDGRNSSENSRCASDAPVLLGL